VACFPEAATRRMGKGDPLLQGRQIALGLDIQDPCNRTSRSSEGDSWSMREIWLSTCLTMVRNTRFSKVLPFLLFSVPAYLLVQS